MGVYDDSVQPVSALYSCLVTCGGFSSFTSAPQAEQQKAKASLIAREESSTPRPAQGVGPPPLRCTSSRFVLPPCLAQMAGLLLVVHCDTYAGYAELVEVLAGRSSPSSLQVIPYGGTQHPAAANFPLDHTASHHRWHCSIAKRMPYTLCLARRVRCRLPQAARGSHVHRTTCRC